MKCSLFVLFDKKSDCASIERQVAEFAKCPLLRYIYIYI